MEEDYILCLASLILLFTVFIHIPAQNVEDEDLENRQDSVTGASSLPLSFHKYGVPCAFIFLLNLL